MDTRPLGKELFFFFFFFNTSYSINILEVLKEVRTLNFLNLQYFTYIIKLNFLKKANAFKSLTVERE